MAPLAATAASLALGLLAFASLALRLQPLAARRKGLELANLPQLDLPGLITLVLPRRLRAAWNLLCVAVITLAFGAPHLLALRLLWLGEPGAARWYAATLPWWLLVMAFPAWIIARHAAARSRPIAA